MTDFDSMEQDLLGVSKRSQVQALWSLRFILVTPLAVLIGALLITHTVPRPAFLFIPGFLAIFYLVSLVAIRTYRSAYNGFFQARMQAYLETRRPTRD